MDLVASSKYWDSWFRGTSTAFAKMSIPRVLVVTDVDQLDSDLTVGQMMGRFGVEVIKGSGHSINEDAPGSLAKCVAVFVERL